MLNSEPLENDDFTMIIVYLLRKRRETVAYNRVSKRSASSCVVTRDIAAARIKQHVVQNVCESRLRQLYGMLAACIHLNCIAHAVRRTGKEWCRLQAMP